MSSDACSFQKELGPWSLTCVTASSKVAAFLCLDNLLSGSKRNVEHLHDHYAFRLVDADTTEMPVRSGVVDAIIH